MAHKHQHIRDDEELAAAIRKAGLKVTPARVALLATMDAAYEPLSLQSEELKDDARFGDRATVYRNLVQFAARGLARLIRSPGKREYYERADTHQHPHVLCRSCGRLECIAPAKTTTRPPRVKGWREIQRVVTYEGLCPDCAA